MRARIAGRFSVPSDSNISVPKWAAIACSAGLPGSTIIREAISASTIVIPFSANQLVTAVLPLPIPPVTPMTNTISLDSGRELFKGEVGDVGPISGVLQGNSADSAFTIQFKQSVLVEVAGLSNLGAAKLDV